MRRARSAPPIWILLDILMLLVLALISVPVHEEGVRYEFLGLPPDSVVFRVELPLDPRQREWEHFDFSAGEWVTSRTVTPHGMENFVCERCSRFLPRDADSEGQLMVGLPTGVRDRIHEKFFRACMTGNCNPTLYIDAQGTVSLRGKDTVDQGRTS